MAAPLRWGQWQWSQSAPVTAPARGDTSTSAVTNIPIVQRQYQQFPLCSVITANSKQEEVLTVIDLWLVRENSLSAAL